MTNKPTLPPHILDRFAKVSIILQAVEHIGTYDTDTIDQKTILSNYEHYWGETAGHIDTPAGMHELYTATINNQVCLIVQTPDPIHYWSSTISIYEPMKDHSYCLSLNELYSWIDSPCW